MSENPVAEVCGDLVVLHAQLGAALTPDPEEADRSSQMRPALLWCATHERSHRRDEWADACIPGQDPRRVGVLLAPARTATAPRYGVRRRVPASGAPLDLEVLDCQAAIADTAVDLATRARQALGHSTREHTAARALAVLPMLLGRLDSGHVVVLQALGSPARDGKPARRGDLAALRQRARYALTLDRRPMVTQLVCPRDQQPYWAGWAQDGAELFWDDGLCRTWTRRGVWALSRLYIRDPDAAPGSQDAAVRCDGCGSVWASGQEFAKLYAMIHGGWEPDPDVERVRRVLCARLARAMWLVVASGGPGGARPVGG